MSYILDALKRSDMQARQVESPSIHSSHAAGSGHGRRPGWQYVLFGCAASGLVLGAAYLLLPDAVDKQMQTSITAQPELTMPPPQQTAIPAAEIPVANITPPPAHLPAEQITTIPMVTQAAVADPADTQTVASSPLPAGQATQAPSPSSAQHEAPVMLPMPDIAIEDSNVENTPPRRNKLPLSVQQALPPINVSGHIYDEQAGSRMVFINGHIQREGDTISPGLRLLAITPTGVDMSFRDMPFRIDLFANRLRSSN